MNKETSASLHPQFDGESSQPKDQLLFSCSKENELVSGDESDDLDEDDLLLTRATSCPDLMVNYQDLCFLN